jgi:cadmium resistance protein CadD (predicted permease)
MTATPTQTWKPGETVIRWAWVSMIALAAGAWIGGIFVFFNPTVSITALVVALPVFYFALTRLWLEIGRDSGIPPTTRSQLRRNLVVFGPVAVLQLLIFVFFPDSGFSGLRRKAE